MIIEDGRATKAIPILLRHADQLIALVDDILKPTIKCKIDKDHFGFMALCYLSEQRNHLAAVSHLVPRGLGRSAGLIARSMVEGLALLKWAAGDPSRPLRWRAYAWVVDWRWMKREESVGRQVDGQPIGAAWIGWQGRIEQGLRQYADQLLSQKAIKSKKQGKPLPKDPYVREWYSPAKIREIFKEVRGEALYEHIYRSESNKTHWSIASLGRNTSREGVEMFYAGDTTPHDSATILAVGFQSLFETLELVADHLNLESKTKIRKLKEDYVAEVSGVR